MQLIKFTTYLYVQYISLSMNEVGSQSAGSACDTRCVVVEPLSQPQQRYDTDPMMMMVSIW